MRKLLLLAIAVGLFSHARAQVVADWPMVVIDSSQISTYPYVFPIMGQRVPNMGFNLPVPHGIMLNTITGTQKLELQNLEVGFNNSEIFNLDSIISFDQVNVYATTVNLRFDTWVLPFLDIYGLAGYNFSNIDVRILEPIQIETNPTTDGAYLGLGATLAGGTGPFLTAWIRKLSDR